MRALAVDEFVKVPAHLSLVDLGVELVLPVEPFVVAVIAVCVVHDPTILPLVGRVAAPRVDGTKLVPELVRVRQPHTRHCLKNQT